MTTIVARTNTTVAPLSDGGFRIVKASGTDGSFDADAVSITSIANDFVLRARRVSSSDWLMVGVGTEPAADANFASIAYAAEFVDGSCGIYEGGAYRSYTPLVSETVWIERIGTTLRYLNGARLRDAAVLRTVTGVSGGVFFDCSLAKAGSAVDVRFDSPGSWSSGARTRRQIALASALAF